MGATLQDHGLHVGRPGQAAIVFEPVTLLPAGIGRRPPAAQRSVVVADRSSSSRMIWMIRRRPAGLSRLHASATACSCPGASSGASPSRETTVSPAVCRGCSSPISPTRPIGGIGLISEEPAVTPVVAAGSIVSCGRAPCAAHAGGGEPLRPGRSGVQSARRLPVAGGTPPATARSVERSCRARSCLGRLLAAPLPCIAIDSQPGYHSVCTHDLIRPEMIR